MLRAIPGASCRLMPRTELHLPYSSYHLSSQDVPRCIIYVEVSYNLWKCVIFWIYIYIYTHPLNFTLLQVWLFINESRFQWKKGLQSSPPLWVNRARWPLQPRRCSAVLQCAAGCNASGPWGKGHGKDNGILFFFNHVLTMTRCT